MGSFGALPAVVIIVWQHCNGTVGVSELAHRSSSTAAKCVAWLHQSGCGKPVSGYTGPHKTKGPCVRGPTQLGRWNCRLCEPAACHHRAFACGCALPVFGCWRAVRAAEPGEGTPAEGQQMRQAGAPARLSLLTFLCPVALKCKSCLPAHAGPGPAAGGRKEQRALASYAVTVLRFPQITLCGVRDTPLRGVHEHQYQ